MNDEQEWVVKHHYSFEEWQEDQNELRHGIPLDKFLYSRMRRALSDHFLSEDIPPLSGHMWFYGGSCDLATGDCELIVRYAHDPEERWIIKRANIPDNDPAAKELKENPEHFNHVWDYVQEHFSIADIANLRNKAEQTLKLL